MNKHKGCGDELQNRAPSNALEYHANSNTSQILREFQVLVVDPVHSMRFPHKLLIGGKCAHRDDKVVVKVAVLLSVDGVNVTVVVVTTVAVPFVRPAGVMCLHQLQLCLLEVGR